MRRFYSFETLFRSLKDGLVEYLKRQGIYYELSGVGSGWHFEIKCTEKEAENINNWLDENTIWCKGISA